MAKQEIFEISVMIVAETEKAVLVDNGSKKAWLPKSMIEYDLVSVTAPVWLLKDKELI